ncbi:putative membrane protein [Cladobotryum mycophilum]|uniref:Membrane protein n=1 Tax=Cladobotryum mycophilum TaxID=491253 RepID=A0ABR0SY92_9HYPO
MSEASPPINPESSLATRAQKRSSEEAEELTPEPQRTLFPYNNGSKGNTWLTADGLRRLSLSPTPITRSSIFPRGPYAQASRRQQPVAVSSQIKQFWIRNKPSILVALSQFFAALMNLNARLLELEGDGMHPVQVLLIRQGLTVIGCCAFGWLMKIPDFPLGKKEIRWLLCLRGFSGFFGIYGMWYSMMYLPLADATVITFLAPGVAGLICYFALREPFTRPERIATVVALLGVVLIARPVSLFSKSQPSESSAKNIERGDGGLPGLDHEVTTEERLLAVGVALLGVLGAAGAFTSLRTIGKRAPPIISVNFFGMACVIICTLALGLAPTLGIAQPHLRWVTPVRVKEWGLLFSLGILGFIMQYLLTSGLGADKSNRANAMVYTHMLFAVSFDRWVFGHTMGVMSFLGCALILGSAITVVLTKKSPVPVAGDVERQVNNAGEAEGSPMLVEEDEDANLERTEEEPRN